MCYCHTAIFDACGHEVPEPRPCGLNCSAIRHISTQYESLEFCKDCFLVSPKPQVGAQYLNNRGRYIGPRNCCYRMNEPSHKVTANDLWARASEHMATNSMDLYIFVDRTQGILPRPARDVLVGIQKHLVDDVWHRIVDLYRTGTMINPSTAERMLILQLQKAIEHDDALTLLGGATTECQRITQVNDAVSFVKPEDMEEGDHCLFCTFDFGSATGDGFKEPAVKLKQCGHVFGATCLTTWLKEQKCCPMCRVELKPFYYHPGDELKVQDLAPEEESDKGKGTTGMPSWMKLFLNDEEQDDHEYLFCGLPKDKMRQYFNQRCRPVQGVSATLTRRGFPEHVRIQVVQPMAESSRRFVCECERDRLWLPCDQEGEAWEMIASMQLDRANE